jgi:tetratricopeptide (TPR) repeat protein
MTKPFSALKQLIFTLLSVMMLGIIPATFAQEATEEPLICDDFADSPDDARISYYMGEGAGFFSAGYYDRAIYSYSCVIEQIDDGFTGAYMQRAAAYSARQDYERALADYTRAIELDGNLLAAYNNRGIVYAARQEYEESLADFNAALERDGGYIPALNNRAVIAAIQGDYTSAIADLQQAIDVSGIGSIYAELSDPDRLPTAEFPEFDRDLSQSYALLGIVYSAQALDNYRAYLLLNGGAGDQRVQSAAGALESRFSFELRLDDGTWLLNADLTTAGEEAGS